MKPGDRIYVAGHRGKAGSALVRRLQSEGYGNLLVRTREELDLFDARAVDRFFDAERPAYVFLLAARVGGIQANAALPAEFIRENLLIQTNVIDAAHRVGVRRLLFPAGSCIYPRVAEQPMPEAIVGTGPMEPTSIAYATAKMAGITMCASYRRQYGDEFLTVVPATLYGPGDHFDPRSSHVLPALLLKLHEAKERGEQSVTLWGTGTPRREFLHVDDLARALLFLMNGPAFEGLLNVGAGSDLSIRELAEKIASVVGYRGRVEFDPSQPDGAPRKMLDSSKISSMGWKPRIPLEEGIRSTYEWFLRHRAAGAGGP